MAKIVEKAIKVKTITDDAVTLQIDQDVMTVSIESLMTPPTDLTLQILDNLRTALKLENVDGNDAVKLKEAIERRTFKTHINEA